MNVPDAGAALDATDEPEFGRDDGGDTQTQDMSGIVTTDSTALTAYLEGLFNFEATLMSSQGDATFYSVGVDYSIVEPIQGDRSLTLNGNFISETNSTFPNLDRALVVGGWVRDRTAADSSSWISQSPEDRSAGWSVGREASRLGCSYHSDEGVVFAGVPVDDFSAWNHVMCEFKVLNSEVEMVAVVNGVESDRATSSRNPTTEIFRAGDWVAEAGFEGDLDELVITTDSRFTLAHQKKLWACGANAELCRCIETRALEYGDCGRAQDDCDSLSPCTEETL